jgi:hypothetical protein
MKPLPTGRGFSFAVLPWGIVIFSGDHRAWCGGLLFAVSRCRLVPTSKGLGFNLRGFQMSVSTANSVRIRGGVKGSGEVVVYIESADDVLGAYESYHEDGASLEEGYAYVVAEAGLEGVAPAFDTLPNIRGWVREIDFVLVLP